MLGAKPNRRGTAAVIFYLCVEFGVRDSAILIRIYLCRTLLQSMVKLLPHCNKLHAIRDIYRTALYAEYENYVQYLKTHSSQKKRRTPEGGWPLHAMGLRVGWGGLLCK